MGVIVRYLLIGTLTVVGGFFVIQPGSGPPANLGKVETIYVEIAPGFLVERKLMKRAQGQVLVEVALAPNSPSPMAYVWMSASDNIEEGDLVNLVEERKVAGRPPRLQRENAQFYESTMLAQLKAKHDTLEAIAFVRHPLALRHTSTVSSTE